MAPIRILIINPNTSQSMTDSLREPVEKLDYNNTTYTFLTAPTGVPSINNLSDASLSATATLPLLLPHLPTHDAFLIACYSPHPLVPLLKTHTPKPVLGIFEASLHTALQLLARNGKNERFGIVSTGAQWKRILDEAVRGGVLGGGMAGVVYAGTETCGLDAGGLHGGGGVEGAVGGAARRLVEGARREGRGEVGVVVLGCAGMVGMGGWVRSVVGEGVRVVDGVVAGVGILQGLVRGGF